MLYCVHYLADRESDTGSQIDRNTLAAVNKKSDSGQVCGCKVTNVNVIAYRGSVGSRIIATEDGQLGKVAHGRKDGTGNEMSLGIMTFTDFTIRVAATSVEVS